MSWKTLACVTSMKCGMIACHYEWQLLFATHLIIKVTLSFFALFPLTPFYYVCTFRSC